MVLDLLVLKGVVHQKYHPKNLYDLHGTQKKMFWKISKLLDIILDVVFFMFHTIIVNGDQCCLYLLCSAKERNSYRFETTRG